VTMPTRCRQNCQVCKDHVTRAGPVEAPPGFFCYLRGTDATARGARGQKTDTRLEALGNATKAAEGSTRPVWRTNGRIRQNTEQSRVTRLLLSSSKARAHQHFEAPSMTRLFKLSGGRGMLWSRYARLGEAPITDDSLRQHRSPRKPEALQSRISLGLTGTIGKGRPADTYQKFRNPQKN
jgi:hypothetical protein